MNGSEGLEGRLSSFLDTIGISYVAVNARYLLETSIGQASNRSRESVALDISQHDIHAFLSESLG